MTARLSMSHIMAALLALFAVAVAQPSAAQTPRPSPAALLLAKQLVEVKGVKKIFDPLVRGVVEKTRDMFMQTNFMWSKDLNEVTLIEEKKYAPRVSELLDTTAHIYATHFSEQELKDLLAFYKSPLGQKALVEEARVADESMAQAGAWGDNLAQEVMTSMREEMKKRGHDM